MILRKEKAFFWFCLLAFFLVRIASFVGKENILMPTITAGFWLAAFFLTIKKPGWGGLVFGLEIFLNGGGEYSSLSGISVRTILFVLVMAVFLFETIKEKHLKNLILENKRLLFVLSIFSVFSIVGMLNGLWQNNGWRAVIGDFIPYSYVWLALPARGWIAREDFKNKMLAAFSAFLIGSLIFSLFTFALFSTGAQLLHGEFYKWFRDFSMGKITDLGQGFFRVVLPEHLLVALAFPAIMFYSSKKASAKFFLAVPSLALLAVNFSRAYFIGILCGLAVLFPWFKTRAWLKNFAFVLIVYIFSFCAIFFIASRGHSFGLDVIGFRAKTYVAPKEETSTATRMMLLPVIWEKIKEKPMFGHGLGSSVEFFNFITKEKAITRQFDWGFLEMWAELGFFGVLFFSASIFAMISRSFSDLKNSNKTKFVFAASLAVLFFLNLTVPAFFHPFGIVLIAFALAAHHQKDNDAFSI